MAVYVDNVRAGYTSRHGRRYVMCHMIADTRIELMTMVDRIGLDRQWLQYPGSNREHFDVSLSKRALAVKAGAIEISVRELASRCRARHGDAGKHVYFGSLDA